ncbi:uncharacterized protein PGYRP7 isoform X2 [Glycine max]|uniref:uncharacterized protein PGYRP7 isoform X2 n=1 Tax=Glycine max TaxID=3847 RepID=UPI000E21C081|nr:uncharacterized protein PGYRP7 isoform X2 [Glycine max]|eukprot:XP_025981464.1 uncharacterized protein PGYRP7 isoform X2 [Glycine max]
MPKIGTIPHEQQAPSRVQTQLNSTSSEEREAAQEYSCPRITPRVKKEVLIRGRLRWRHLHSTMLLHRLEENRVSLRDA